jgi:phosphatidylinositol-4,5-bisphosphate 4-phosphatase
VYDRLDERIPDQAKLRAEIREQTNLVREMFASEAFKRGNGDPAKMSRHIIDLQGLAEQSLKLIGDTNMAATMSKGCKSDTDRGGVVDVEWKADKMIRHMGGQVRPDVQPKGDDKQILYAAYAASGQQENQRYNKGVPGSKETDKLLDRIIGKALRKICAGLGACVDE